MVHIENNFLIIPKNDIEIFIKNDDTDPNINFWKNIFGQWEVETFNVFDNFLSSDKVFIDIGGWIGTTCIYGSKKSKHVFTVEADINSFKDLCRNCSINARNITTINKAIFNNDNEDIIFGKNKFLQNSTLNDSTSQVYDINDVRSDDCYVIKSITVLSLIEIYNINPLEISLIKVDIEGGEENILDDLFNLSKLYKIPLYISFHYSWWKNKDLNRFVSLSEDQKKLIIHDPFCSIVFQF